MSRRDELHLCRRCRGVPVRPESWTQSGRLCPVCVMVVKAEIVRAIEADLPRLVVIRDTLVGA